MQSLKIDLEQDEVFVFTPKGKVITLPTGATPVDFAYAIHTEVGHRCIGARVNGRLIPLDGASEVLDVEPLGARLIGNPQHDVIEAEGLEHGGYCPPVRAKVHLP